MNLIFDEKHKVCRISSFMTLCPIEQKYPNGTIVWINKIEEPWMSHFDCERPAIVEYTYHGKSFEDGRFSKGDKERSLTQYSLLIRHNDGHWSSAAWYEEHQLISILSEEKANEYLNELKSQYDKMGLE